LLHHIETTEEYSRHGDAKPFLRTCWLDTLAENISMDKTADFGV